MPQLSRAAHFRQRFSALCLGARSKKRRRWAALGSVCAAALLPSTIFQIVLYRQNLAAARETFPLAAPLQKSDRVLVISPHCDDETLGAGGTLNQAHRVGAATRVVFLTNGDGSGSTRLVQQAHEFENEITSLARASTWRALLSARPASTPAAAPPNLFQRIAAMRQSEALAACKTLGVPKRDVIFLGYPDGGTRAMWETNWTKTRPYFSRTTQTQQSPYKNSFTPRAKYCGAQALQDVEKVIREFRPTRIITTNSEDTHPDHWAAYAYTSAALEALRLSPDASTRAMATRARLSTFLVHHGNWPAPHGYFPQAELAPPASLENGSTRWRSEPLSTRNRNAKKAALDCYASQLVFTPLYLRSFIRKNELFATASPSVSKLEPQIPNLRLVDAPCDSLWSERWSAADIRALDAFAARGVLTLRVELGRAPSSRVRYRVSLHALDGRSTRAFEIVAARVSKNMNATLFSFSPAQNGDDRENRKTVLNAKFGGRGLEIQIPLRDLGVLASRDATLLISSSTSVGATRLDQSATAILHLHRHAK